MAGNSKFRGIVFCNLDIPETVISNFVRLIIETPYLSPYGHPNNAPLGQKNVGTKKASSTKKASRTKTSLGQQCINSFLAHKLSHDRWLWLFFLGACNGNGSLPDAAIWWCLRTGGGGVVTILCSNTVFLPNFKVARTTSCTPKK